VIFLIFIHIFFFLLPFINFFDFYFVFVLLFFFFSYPFFFSIFLPLIPPQKNRQIARSAGLTFKTVAY